MSELDLTDPEIRRMAERNHQPDEVWAANGTLISVYCEKCGNDWPCVTRRRLDATRPEPRDPTR